MSINVEQRKVVEEVSGWLRVFDDGSVDRTWVGPPEVKFMSDPVPAHDQFIDGVSTRDITIDQESGLRVRVYQPELEENEKVAVILHLHGGGFCISQADWYMYYAVYTQLARMARAVVVSVYLRLAPEHRLPAAIDDGYSALLWLASQVRAGPGQRKLTPHADLGRVFLIGDSSGGNLVHHVAARGGDISPARIAGLIPIHPGFCRAERSRSEREMPETPFLTLDMADKFLGLALPEGATKDQPVTCPWMGGALAMEEVAEAPMMLCVAEKDLVIDTEMEYYEAMKKAGKKVELMVSKGMTHSFYLNRIAVEVDPATKAQTHLLFQAIVDFINRN